MAALWPRDEIAYSHWQQTMGDQPAPRFGTKAEYARHRGVSQPYISKLAKNGVLVMRGNKVDFRASDMVLDDKPVEDVDPPPTATSAAASLPSRPTADSLPQAGGASFGQARTIEMVFRAKLRRLEFETKQGRLIEAEAVRNSHLRNTCGRCAMACWGYRIAWRPALRPKSATRSISARST